jgi:hypothetical protein
MALLADRGKGDPGAIEAPATNLTLGTGVLALVTAIVAAWNDAFKTIFGDNASQDIRKDVLVASIFGFAIVAAADLLARAYSKAATDRSTALMAGAAFQDAHVQPVTPSVAKATITLGDDDPGYRAVAVRIGSGGERIEYLLVRSDKTPQWRAADEVNVGNPDSSDL